VKINWEIFFGDSSSEEAIVLFALGKSTFNEWAANCSLTKERVKTIKILKQRGYKKAIRGAQRALRKRPECDCRDDYKDWSHD
jgi:hypothetical protein